MTEPSVEEIVEELAADIRVRAPTRFSASYSSTADFKIGALIDDWRKRGEVPESIRAKIETSKREAADTLEAEPSKYWEGWVDSCTEILDAFAALTPQRQPPA